MSKREKVIDFIRKHSVVRPKDLTDVGLPRDYLYQLAQEGVIERVGRGLYQWPGRDSGCVWRIPIQAAIGV